MSTTAPAPAARLGVIRYMGNKLALLEDIREAVERLAPQAALVVDPMAGSQAVPHALKDRYRILSSDAQAHAAVVGKAFVDNVDLARAQAGRVAALREAAERVFAATGRGFLEESFAETYLGARQCRQLDALRAAVDRVAPDHDDPHRWLFLTALMTAACRGQASPGHFAQFLPPEHPRTQRQRRVDVFDVTWGLLATWTVRRGLPGSRSLSLPWRELVRTEGTALAEAAAWYLDPPYTRDQYSRFYHFLETLVRGDRPALRHKARYRTDRFRSAFCSPRTARQELSDLLETIREVSPCAAVVLSYSSRGLLSRPELEDAVTRRFRLIAFREIPHRYSTQGKGVLDGVTEWLLSLTPRG